MKKLFLIFIAIISHVIIIYAQNPQWIQYTNGDEVWELEVENNILWIGTLGGLVEYDLVNTNTTFYNNANSGLPHNWVQEITIDANGTKWIGTWSGGMASFDGTNWTVYDMSNTVLPSNYIRSIAIDNNGTKWIAASVLTN
ncbi:MAG: hypothetical protein K0B08_12310 [Bacteroidales bacterium]|nr:hypothetical protein [Bacteroidales bacterium]